MDARRDDPDIVVIGGGPAGSAAALCCARAGFSVVLLERDQSGAERPGETMHPGLWPLLQQLGLGARLGSLASGFHEGVWIEWGKDPARFQPYGADEQGAWRGFHVWRPDFDQALLDLAAGAGVDVRQPCALRDIGLDDGGICRLETDGGTLRPRMTIDASGRARHLARRLGLEHPPHSPRLIARYGYVTGSCPGRDEAPRIAGSRTGWTWTARIQEGLYQWTRVDFASPVSDDWSPPEFAGLAPLSRTRGADVTWRIAERLAGGNWLLAGDAAATLDPTSGRGVLKAIMTGMMAAHLVGAVLHGKIPQEEAAAFYERWLRDWFRTDAVQMAEFYRLLV